MAGVTLKAVSKSFGHTVVLEDIDLEIRDGEFLVVVGPSGCGKSTLLRLVAGLEAASSGDIAIGTRIVTSLPPAARGVAMVFQSYALYPHMTAYDNLAFGLTIEKRSRHEVDARIREAARLLRIEDLLDRKPAALSGGQRQRVAIGRAIVRSPQVFLFDEPLSNLDAALRADMRLEMARLHRTLNATTVYVTHDQSEAMTLGDRIVLLNRGRVEQIGSPLELYRRPATQFVAEFLGNPKINLFDARVVRCACDGVEIDAAGQRLFIPVGANDLAVGQLVHVGLRPESLVPDMEGELTIEGEIDAVEALGHATVAHVATALGTLAASISGTREVERGRRLRLGLRGTDCHVFDLEGLAVSRS